MQHNLYMNIGPQDISLTRARIDFLHQSYNVLPNQCTSFLVQKIKSPLPLVWSIVRPFHRPQTFKKFIKNCIMVDGDGGPQSIRQVTFVSGFPASFSLEKLDWIDDDLHAMKYSILGGDHRLANYKSITTLHEEVDQNGGKKTVVTNSYVVDVPVGNTKEETCCFLDTILGCNLRSLACISEKLASY